MPSPSPTTPSKLHNQNRPMPRRNLRPNCPALRTAERVASHSHLPRANQPLKRPRKKNLAALLFLLLFQFRVLRLVSELSPRWATSFHLAGMTRFLLPP